MYQTQCLARKLYHQLRPLIHKKALIIALEGPLGSGKTTFTKAFAKAMGVADTIVSPTFTLHEEYDQFDHLDLWRVEDPSELTALGLKRMVKAKRVIVIEWAEKAGQQILNFKSQATIIWIKFEYGKKTNERIIKTAFNRV